MELVYLWVEKYKNIEKQGFNFSPRFDCEYKDEKLEIKSKEHIDNFFGENINITAIVGENGSGKSSILKLILFLIFCKNYKKGDDYPIGSLVYSLRQFPNKELFLIVDIDGEFKKITFSSFIRHLMLIEFGDENTTRIKTGSSPKKEEILKNIPELDQKELKFFTFYLNYMLDTLNDGFHDNWINKIYHRPDNYERPLLIQPDKHEKDTLNDVINLFMIDFINQRRLILLYKDITKNQKITNFFNPNYVWIENSFIDNYRVDNTNSNYIELTTINKVANKLNTLLYIKKKSYNLDNKKIPIEFKKIENARDYEYMNLLYLVFKILTIDKKLFYGDKYNSLEKDILKKIENNELPTKDYLSKYNFEEIIQGIDKNDYRIKKILISIDFHNKSIYNNKFFKLIMNGEKLSITDIKNILEYLPAWIDIVFYDNNISFESLSSGEKSLFRMIIDIVYQIQKVKLHYKNISIMLDETELGLHPQWQKEYIKNILESIKLHIGNDFSINLIFATHSPFILSDLPKENVIFLKDGKEVKGIDKKQTFGANIHTLLSDGFFMDGGLMGEFAKGKIDKVIKLLNSPKKLTDKEIQHCENIISILGEPIIKNQLQRMLDSKRLKKVDKIDLIEKQIKELQEELKKVQK